MCVNIVKGEIENKGVMGGLESGWFGGDVIIYMLGYGMVGGCGVMGI